MSNKIVLEIKYHVTGDTHSGYCSGNEESTDVNYFYTEQFNVDKDFVREFIDDDGWLDEWKLYEYKKIELKDVKEVGIVIHT